MPRTIDELTEVDFAGIDDVIETPTLKDALTLRVNPITYLFNLPTKLFERLYSYLS